jgi:uncharacterized OB-fold protein
MTLSFTKVCRICTVAKHISEFHRNRARRDGLQTICKSCEKASVPSRRKDVAAAPRGTRSGSVAAPCISRSYRW